MDEASPPGLLTSFGCALERRNAHSARRQLTICHADSVDFSSNDFLSLATSNELREAYQKELTAQRHLPIGSGGSRLLDGNSRYAEKLESDIAAFHDAEAGLLFNSGFDANAGVFSSVPQLGDVVLYDEYIHASAHEGMRLSRASLTRAFAHNDVADLRRLLLGLLERDDALRGGQRNVFVAVESVYSMDGDVAPLVGILDLLDDLCPLKNAHVIVDEAHSTGVFGTDGRGLVCALNVQHRVLARLHTFGKALSANGAILLCPPVMREYLINYARPLIYTTFMALPALVLIRSAYQLLQTGMTAARQAHLWDLTSYLHLLLQQRLRGFSEHSQALALPLTEPTSPIFSLLSPRPRSLAAHCQQRGFIVRAIVPPTVPEGGQRVRVCLHSGNTRQEIEGLVSVICEWVEKQLEHPRPKF